MSSPSDTQAYFIIRSEDRNKGLYPSPARFTITPNEHSFVSSGIRSLEGESFQMFYNIPNINERNNIIVFDDGSTSYPITVPEAFYTYVDLGEEIKAQMNSIIGAGHDFKWDPVLLKYTLQAPAPLRVTKFPGQRRDLAGVVGFAYDQALSVSIVGGCADLNYTRDIYVTTNRLHRNKRAQDQASEGIISDVLMVVPLYSESDYWDIFNRKTTPYDTLLKPRNLFHMPTLRKLVHFNDDESISNIDILLLDDQGEELYNPFSDNPDFSYKFRLTINANHI